MCRFLVYKGSDEILLSKLILDPSHSILTQSFDCRLRLDIRRPINADGFGIGYYTDPKLGPEPCIFTSTTPAWNCINLERLASKTASSLIFAHVRATTESSLSDDNCHPFSHGSLMWMHNGGLGGWKHIKRRLGERLADKWYLGVNGGTDSEWAFALFLHSLQQMGHDPSVTPEGGFGPNVLRKAMLETIGQINAFIAEIPDTVIAAENVDTRSLLNFAVSDGHSVVCSRYVNSGTDEAASLYYSSGTTWHDKRKGNFQMDRRDKGADIVLVASEPLTFERDNWVTVPTNSTITIHKQTVMIHPIIDKYRSHSPSRWSKFADAKDLATNEKAPTPAPPSTSPFPAPHRDTTPTLKSHLTSPTSKIRPPPQLPFQKHERESLFRSLTPELYHPLPSTSSSRLLRPYSTEYPPSAVKLYAESGAPHLDIRRVTSLPIRDRSRPQEQGNTKKKRSSVQESEVPARLPTPPERTAYGDPAKIAKFFPELDLS